MKRIPSIPLELRLHRALREYPRYNQFLVLANGTELSLVETHVLVELDIQLGMSQSDLIQKLGLNKVVISRTVKNLGERKLIAIHYDHNDRRIQRLRLSEKGKRALEEFDNQANHRLDIFIEQAGLKENEIDKLARFFDKLASGLGALHSSKRSADHLLRPSIRRLTRAFKLLDSTALNTNLSTIEWQILLTLGEHNNRLTPTDLAFLFKVDRVTITIALRTLQKFGYVSKKTNRLDRRSDLLSCGPTGLSLIQKIETLASKRLHAAGEITSSEVSLAERFIRGAALDFFLSQQGLEVRELRTESEFQSARRAMINRIQTFPAQYVSGYLFSEDSRCLGLFYNEELCAAAECRGSKCVSEPRTKLVNLVNLSQLHPDSVRGFILRVVGSDLTTPIDKILTFGGAVPEAKTSNLAPENTVSSSLGELFRFVDH